MLVDDATEPGRGQIRRADFLAAVEQEIERVAGDSLSAVGCTTRDCPYLAYWLRYYSQRSAADIERAVQHYARPDRGDLAGLNDAIARRVRSAVEAWIRSGGREVQDPALQAPPAADRAADAPHIQRKALDGSEAAPPAPDPAAVGAETGDGRPLDQAVRSRMEGAFGRSFADVRVHSDARAARRADSLSARAFTLGRDISFGRGQYRPGSPSGDLLIAHELAHVAQQRHGEAQRSARAQDDHHLEREADLAAGNAMLRMHSRAHDLAALPDVAVTSTSGLRLSRCSYVHAPTDLTTVEAKAEWIRTTLPGSAGSKSKAIADVLATLSLQEFIDIQSRLDMSSVMDALDDWDAIRMGTLGPVQGGVRDRLNRIRADFLYEMKRDRGAAESQVVAHWIFSNMYGDDIRDVLTLLGADQHLYNTVDDMPAVLEVFVKRGIDRTKFHDRGWKAGDIGRGLKNFGKSVLESSPAARDSKGGSYLRQDMDMPEEYRRAMGQVMSAELEEAWKPSNVFLGTLDYLAFNIPSSVKGVVTGTVSGVSDLAQGHVESGTEKLTGSVIFVIGLALGVRAFRKSARLGALLEMTAEGRAALVKLRASIGQAGIDRVARYVQADSQAAFLVREQGLAGIEALEKAAGDVAAARKLIGTNVGRMAPLLTADTLGGIGLETQQALATLPDNVLTGLAGTDAATLDSLAQMLREGSPALRQRLTALAQSNPSGFGELLRSRGTAALDTLRTGPFATVDALAGQVGKSAQRVRVPVVKDGVTLYESIDPKNPPPGWKFKDSVVKRGGKVTIRTDVTGPNGAQGHFIRSFNPATGELEMLEAFLTTDPGKIPLPDAVPGGVELRPGKGTSTVTYATLRQLRTQGMSMGSLRRLVMRDIENVQSISRLEWMRRNFPGRSLNELVLSTDSVSYASTAVEQSGSRIVGGRISGGKTRPIGQLMAEYEARAAEVSQEAASKLARENEALLKQYGFDRNTPMLTNFDIEVDLQPITPAGQATPAP